MPGTPSTPRRLSRERIVAEALAVAEREGLDGVTLRPLAARLGVSATALYRHVDSRAELLALVLDRRLEEHQRAVPEDLGWKDALRWEAENMWRIYRPIPGLAAVTLAGSVSVERGRASARRMLSALTEGGFGDEAPSVVVWFVQWTLSYLAAIDHRPPVGEGYGELRGPRVDEPRAVYDQGVELLIAGLEGRLAAVV
ncbi:TetR/AcrR family transcriptional regulator [Patulibacter sp. S7RM1-6]